MTPRGFQEFRSTSNDCGCTQTIAQKATKNQSERGAITGCGIAVFTGNGTLPAEDKGKGRECYSNRDAWAIVTG